MMSRIYLLFNVCWLNKQSDYTQHQLVAHTHTQLWIHPNEHSNMGTQISCFHVSSCYQGLLCVCVYLHIRWHNADSFSMPSTFHLLPLSVVSSFPTIYVTMTCLITTSIWYLVVLQEIVFCFVLFLFCKFLQHGPSHWNVEKEEQRLRARTNGAQTHNCYRIFTHVNIFFSSKQIGFLFTFKSLLSPTMNMKLIHGNTTPSSRSRRHWHGLHTPQIPGQSSLYGIWHIFLAKLLVRAS